MRNGHCKILPVEETLPLRAYFHSASTLNYIRALLSSGFADLHQPRNWSFSHVHSPQLQKAFEEVIDSLMDSLDFMRSATGGSNPGGSRGGTETVDFYTRQVCQDRQGSYP